MIAAEVEFIQIPLIEFVESDDLYLERQEDILFVGCRHDTKRFLFRAPEDAQGVPVCQPCPLRKRKR